LVEKDITVKVRLEVDEGSKQAVQNKAQAIRETGQSPIQSEDDQQGFGIFAGERVDPEIKGFQKRKTNIRTPFKDTTSAAPFQRSSPFGELVNRLDGIEDTISTPEKMQKLLGVDPTNFSSLLNIGRNPGGFLLQILGTVGLPLAFVTALIKSPQMVQGFINILKDSRIIGVFKRDVLNERNPFLSREQQRARQIAETSVIFSNTNGFTQSNGNLTTNTLSQVRANGISDIGLRDRSGGLF